MNANVAKAQQALIEAGFEATVENNVMLFTDADGNARFVMFDFLISNAERGSVFYTKGGKLESNCTIDQMVAAARC